MAALLHGIQYSGRQSNFAPLNRGRHLCSAGRPSGWALAHILVFLVFFISLFCCGSVQQIKLAIMLAFGRTLIYVVEIEIEIELQRSNYSAIILYRFQYSQNDVVLSLMTSRQVRWCTGIGADDMFHLMIEWRATSPRDDTELRLSNTLRSAAVSITITSLTQLLAFCIGATSPFLAVRNFCACSGQCLHVNVARSSSDHRVTTCHRS